MINRLLILSGILIGSLLFTSSISSSSFFETNSTLLSKTNRIAVESAEASEPASLAEEIELLYEEFSSRNNSMPSPVSFENGMKGYFKLDQQGEIKNEILSIVDFSLPSSQKRLWILDMSTKEVLYHTYVAHGKNTGLEMATDFSNVSGSHKSSLGFYVTAETYYGKNGLSLFIDGKDKGFNSNARERYVVIHGADYATPGFVNRVGRLGRSYGCPALPTALSKEIIETIKGKSCFFIYYPSEKYLNNSAFLNSETV